jgi:hypothetical protein
MIELAVDGVMKLDQIDEWETIATISDIYGKRNQNGGTV